MEQEEEEEIKETNLKRHEERCDCRYLPAVIAAAKLNKKQAGGQEQRGTKGAKEKEDGQQEETVETGLRIRPSPGFSSSLEHPGRTTRKGRCSRRSARRLTRHIITPSPLNPPKHPAFSVQLAAPRFPSARLVLFLLLLLLLLSYRSLHPSIFSGSNPRRFDSRGPATPPSPLRLKVGAIWPLLHAGYITAALLNYARYFSSRGAEGRDG